mmetsp:Transcript_26041/g.60181  ORF Transcript_26041/g.60181 Transcript_26041/m.60181 type:complete len:233 (-) Transcript_26041:38-736(-)
MMLLRLAIAVICLLHFVEASKFSACLKHCQAKLSEKGQKRAAKDEAAQCRERCLPHKEKWDAEHSDCYDECLEGKVADSHNKRECSKTCHRKAVDDHAKERFHHRMQRDFHDQERKKQGLPPLGHEKRQEKHKRYREKLIAELGIDPEARTKVRACVAECRAGKADWEKDVRECGRQCQRTHMGHEEPYEDRIKEHLMQLRDSGEFHDDDDDVWGVLKHHHSGPGIDGGLEL